jgi:hypothetical protein
MKRILFAFASVVLVLSDARAEEPVHFADAGLQAAVEEALWVPDPTPTDMLGLTFLDAPDRVITDLTGLEYATNLQVLRLLRNNITSIAVVAHMTDLEELVVNNNRISDLSSVAGLTKLKHLDVHDNHAVTDVAALAALTNLERLVLRGNLITDIAPLAGLTKLRWLYLEDNRISDIAPLMNLPPLELLNLEDNPLNEQACNTYIPLLWARNPGMSLRYNTCGACRLLLSSTAGGSIVRPGEGEFLQRSGTLVWLEARADPSFVFENWSGSILGRSNPLCITLFSDLQIRASFRSVHATLYVDDDASRDPQPGDSTQSDPNEDGTPEHPFDSIQKAIDVAAEGSSIVVYSGTYRENIQMQGKSLLVLGLDPQDPNGGPCAVLEGAGAGPVMRVTHGGPNCTLAGLVVRGGQGPEAGAILCDKGTLNITNCLIVGNRTTDPNGAAVYGTDSRLFVTNCTIADNSGGAPNTAVTLVDSELTMTNSILWNETTEQILALGTSKPVIRYCDVRGWWADVGNLQKDPLFARAGGGAGVGAPDAVLPAQDVRAAWMWGDYHLRSQAGRWDPDTQTWVQDDVTSPCIDRGDRASPVGHEPAPHGGIINMGAYGGTSEASKSFLPNTSGQEI